MARTFPYVHRQIAIIRELLAQDKIRAAEGKKQKKKDDEHLKKVVELSADTHQRIRNLLKIVQRRDNPPTQNS